jgi:hypothetical protein
MRCEKGYQSLICEGIKILSIQWQESIIFTTLWLDVEDVGRWYSTYYGRALSLILC